MDHLLSQLASSVSGAEDLEGMTRPLLELLETVTGLESTYLTTIDQLKGVQHILYARNSKQMQIPEGLSVLWEDTLCKRALDEGRPVTDDVAGCWGDSDAARALGIQTYLSQPVRTGEGRLYGTLCAASASKLAVDAGVVKVLTLFARLIAHQVEREQMLDSLRRRNEELSSHALTDPLSGVANRRGLMQELRRRMAEVRREGRRLQVAFIDLDGFKSINDRYGHEVGDQFLAAIASRLATSVRAGDFVARYGGDEFVVLVPDASLEDLGSRLERLTIGRYVCKGVPLEYGGASVGVAVSAPDEADVEQLLARADAAMYEVKRRRKAAAGLAKA